MDPEGDAPRIVRVRDSKDHTQGELAVAPAVWAAFTAFVRARTV
ncbi:DUF397 domain-containing protein [Streptomyces sp. NPDC056222]